MGDAVLHFVMTRDRVVWALRSLWARPRLVLVLEVLFVAYFTMFLLAPPAMAEAPNPLSALDRRDGSGFLVSDYNLHYETGVTEPIKSLVAFFVTLMWDGYRYGVGAAALLIDVTFTFKWLDYLISPIEQTAAVLDDLLEQFPAVRQLLITLAIGVGLARMWFGQQARGLVDMAGSMIAWGVSAAVLVNPVTWITGPEGILTRTREAAQVLSAQMVDPEADAASSEEAANALAEQIVTTFVRKPHQFVAYGGLADGGGCQGHYEDNLKAGGEELAKAMKACSPDFGETITNPSTITLVTMMIIGVGALFLLGIAVLTAVVIVYEVLNMLMTCVLMVWELFRAIGPGGSWRGLLGVGLNFLETILALLLVVMIGTLYLGVVEYFFSTWEESMIVMFLIVDVVLLATIAVVITQRRRLRKQLDRLRERTKAGSKNIPTPQRISGMGRGGFSAGLATAAGSRLGHAAANRGGSVAGRIKSAGARVGSAATAPARKVGRFVTRPGFMASRMSSNLLHRSGIHDKATHGAVRRLAYAAGERKWRRKETIRDRRRAARAERKQRAKHWTWAGGQREIDQQRAATAQQAHAGPAPGGRRPRRRPVSPASTPVQPGHPPRTGAPHRGPRADKPDPSPRPERRETSAAPSQRTRSASPTGSGPDSAPRATAAGAQDRLRSKMRARRASAGPRASRTVKSRARSSRPAATG